VASVPVARSDGTFRDVAARTAAVALLVLLAAVVNGWSPLVPVAVAVAGGTYASELSLDHGSLDAAAPAIAVGLLLAAELAYWSLDERERIPGESGESLRRAGFVALLGLGAFLVGATVLALTDAIGGGGIALDFLGAAAAVAALFAIVAAALTERRAD
jgi:hypothetical protein